MELIKNNLSRNKIAFIFFVILLISVSSLLIVYIWQYYQLSNYGTTVSLEEIKNSDFILKVVTYFFYIPLIGAIISFLYWFRRAYYNLIQVNHAAASYSDGWAVGWWFIPFANYYMPYKTMAEIWKGTIQACGINTTIKYPGRIINIWWCSWLLRAVFTIGMIFRPKTTLPDIQKLRLISAGSEVAGIVAIVMLLILLKRFQIVERNLNETLLLAPDSIFAVQVPSYNNDTASN